MDYNKLMEAAKRPQSLSPSALVAAMTALADTFDGISKMDATAETVIAMDEIGKAAKVCRGEYQRRFEGGASAPRGRAGGMIPAMAAVRGRATPSPSTSAPRATSTIAAATHAPGISPGQPLENRRQLGEAMAEQLRLLGPQYCQPGESRRRLVASVRWDYPEERQLGADADINTARIDAVTGLDAARYDRSTGALVATEGYVVPSRLTTVSRLRKPPTAP